MLKVLKRDLKKWENISVSRSETGKLGGLKSGEARRTKLKQKEANEASASKSKQNEHVNDTVNDIKNIYTDGKPSAIDFNKFILIFNRFANRNFKLTEKIKTALKARLKEYTKDDILKAIKKAHDDQYHKDTNFKYLTPEFILRSDKLEKFLNAPEKPTKLIQQPWEGAIGW